MAPGCSRQSVLAAPSCKTFQGISSKYSYSIIIAYISDKWQQIMSIRKVKKIIELPRAVKMPLVSKGIDVVGGCAILKNAFLFVKKANPANVTSCNK